MQGVALHRDAGGNTAVTHSFEQLADAQQDFAQQLVDLENALTAWLAGKAFDAAVVRSMDYSPLARRGNTAQRRYAVEGVLLATVRRSITLTEPLDGRLVGQRLDMTKAAAEAQAAGLCGGPKAEAGSAALAALAAVDTP